MSTAQPAGTAPAHEMRAHVGDRLIVDGDQARTGLIIAVPRPDGTPPYVVKWLATGHIAMVSPGPYARVIPAGTASQPSPAGWPPAGASTRDDRAFGP